MKIKKITSIALSAMMAAAVVPFNEATVPYNSISSYAAGAEASKSVAEGTLGENIAWTLYDSGQLSISGSGAILGSDGANPWGEYTDDITSVVLEHGITEIGDYAFYGCENLIFVSLEYKGGLDRIGLNAFDGCSKLMDMEIGGHIGKIGDFAFNGCEMLDKITITNSDCVIADSQFVFHENTVIEGFAGSTAEIYSNNYNREFASLGVITPDSGEQEVAASGTCGATLTWSIYDDKRLVIKGNGVMDSYEGYSNWEEYTELFDIVEYSGELENYGEYAFYNCKNLKEFEIAPVIGAHAFEGCSNISGVKVPKGFVLNEIGDYAFYGCDNLGMLIIGNPECVIADSPYVFPEDMVIYGVAGSTAQAYAEKYNREFIDISAPDLGWQAVVAKGTCGENLTWKIYEDERCLIVSGYGAMDSYENPDETPWADYYNYIGTVRLESGVENIGENTLASLNSGYLNIIIIENPVCFIPDSETTIPARIAIGGAAGSTAEAYAEKYNREFLAIVENDEGLPIAEGMCGESAKWALYDGGFLEIYGEGKMVNYDDFSNTPWAEYADSIKELSIGENIASISENAFAGCLNIRYTSIYNSKCKIPDSVYALPTTSIIGYCGSTAEAYAKKYHMGFKAIPTVIASGQCGENIDWAVYDVGILSIDGKGAMVDFDDFSSTPWFEYADLITQVNVGDIDSVGENAFSGLTKLQDISFNNLKCVIPDSEDAIPDRATINGNLGSLAIEYAKKYDKDYYIYTYEIARGELVNGQNWTFDSDGYLMIDGSGNMPNYEGDNPWSEFDDSIIAVYLNSDITSIGDYAFYNCTNLKNIFTNATVIGEHAFEGCTSLLPVTLKEADKIGDYAFYNTDVSRVEIFNPECEIADSPYVFPEDTIIYGYKNSTAEEYARKYERMFLAFQTFLLGDVNKDGKIDSTDASAVLAEYAASQTGGELTLYIDAADVNDDGLVNSSDASAILEYYAKASIGEEPSWNLTDVTK